MKNKIAKERLTRSQKNANNKQWYKDKADMYSVYSQSSTGYGGVHNDRRMKVNYDLYNNIIDISDFEYVCKPFGEGVGELPAKMINRDISSTKIKALLGLQMKKAFPWKVIATNSEATTRREEKEFGEMKDYLISETMGEIRQEIEIEMQEKTKGRKLNPEEQQKIQSQIQKELKARTPLKVKKYMEREYQDPAEVLGSQLLNYFLMCEDIESKLNDSFKHFLLSGVACMFIGDFNDEMNTWLVNPIRIEMDYLDDNPKIEDKERISVEYRMTFSEVVKYFGDDLTDEEIDKIYDEQTAEQNPDLFHFDWGDDRLEENDDTLSVVHTQWKSLTRIGFLTYKSSDGSTKEKVVFEGYKLNKEYGDIDIEWRWYPETHEAWVINGDIYKRMRPVPGQFKDENKLHDCTLNYYGIICDNMNSEPTSLMDRLKTYQYYYNIVMYRLELLLASDKGKKVMMNINAIPDSSGIDIKKWKYFFESSPFMWYDPNEEGVDYNDVSSLAKEIDLSLVGDISKYIEIAQYLKQQAGESVGITPEMEGRIDPDASVGNVQQNIISGSNVVEPYYNMFDSFKKHFFQGILDFAKTIYTGKNSEKLTYVLDDMSVQTLNIDVGLLQNSTLGIFVSNSSKTEESRKLIQQLSHAAMQTQAIKFSAILDVMEEDSTQEAKERLRIAEKEAEEFEMEKMERESKNNMAIEQQRAQAKEKEHENKLEEIRVKEGEERKTEIMKMGLMGASYNPELDKDNDGENDFIEMSRKMLETEIKEKKQNLDERKFEEEKKQNEKKIKLEKQKIKSKKE